MNQYYIDAFTGPAATGNRACVIELDEWLPTEKMLELAKRNGLPETAFFVKQEGDDQYALKWFTPDIEMDLCGHATLATGYAISSLIYPKINNSISSGNNFSSNSNKNHCINRVLKFDTNSGEVAVEVAPDGRLTLDFPSRMPEPAKLPENIMNALNFKPLEVYKARDYVLLYSGVDQIENIEINRAEFDLINMDPGGVIITAPAAGSKYTDCCFVSRFFTPQATILEDPVTGSAHCSLIPFWAKRLGKSDLTARQLSKTGGILYCKDQGERVKISGYATEVK